MQYRQLGDTAVQVSRICLGTMTWGQQNSQQDAKDQLAMAREYGVNFIDTAELYAVPTSPESQGATERFLGQALKDSGGRDSVVIATKMAGPGVGHIRDGVGLRPEHVASAVDASLARLQTDYIDLYQLHWPQRATNTFAQRDFNPSLHADERGEQMLEMLQALAVQIQAGKIRYIGVSNETPWGLMRYLALHREQDLPRIQSCQNPYSLLQRNWDVGCAEVSIKERVGLLGYSPLAGGALTGKYLNGNRPEGARFSLPWGRQIMARHAANADSPIVQRYADLAQAQGLSLAQLAIAFVNQRPFTCSNIIGATTQAQLRECLEADDVELSAEVLEQIERLHEQYPSPSLGR